jgi:hypothetical protein
LAFNSPILINILFIVKISSFIYVCSSSTHICLFLIAIIVFIDKSSIIKLSSPKIIIAVDLKNISLVVVYIKKVPILKAANGNEYAHQDK